MKYFGAGYRDCAQFGWKTLVILATEAGAATARNTIKQNFNFNKFRNTRKRNYREVLADVLLKLRMSGCFLNLGLQFCMND